MTLPSWYSSGTIMENGWTFSCCPLSSFYLNYFSLLTKSLYKNTHTHTHTTIVFIIHSCLVLVNVNRDDLIVPQTSNFSSLFFLFYVLFISRNYLSLLFMFLIFYPLFLSNSETSYFVHRQTNKEKQIHPKKNRTYLFNYAYMYLAINLIAYYSSNYEYYTNNDRHF